MLISIRFVYGINVIFLQSQLMKKTALFNVHHSLGAKMAPFGGFEMPIQYSSVTKEHLAVRNSVGVFDVSHMGEFLVEGENAFTLLQYVCSNDISKLKPGKAQYNCFPNGEGGIVDDLIVYQLHDTRYLLVVNASNIEKDWAWLQKQNGSFNASLTNQSDTTALLAIQGPKALEALQPLTDIDLATLPFYAHQTGTFAGHPEVLIATTGYTGSGGVEIYFKAQHAEDIWNKIFAIGEAFQIVPVGLAARDTLRLEMGYCLYGHEINNMTSPIAAGLGWITKPATNCIDAERYIREQQEGTSQKLVGIRLEDRGIPRADYVVVDEQDHPIGKLTSGTQSPILKKGIGLAYIDRKFTAVGTTIFVKIRDKNCAAKIVSLPFIKP